jgi:cystathionine gamma-synthase
MDLSLATLAVTAGRPPVRPDEPLNTPVVLASTYHAGGDVGYGRYGNPTWSAFEEAVGALEGGQALAFASGIAALSAVLGTLGHGSTVVAPSHPYTGTAGLLAEHEATGRLVVRRVDVTDAAAVAAACDGAALLWLESPTNPLLGVADVSAACTAAHTVGAVVAVDNTFNTPVGLRPLSLGADVVVHSVTKQMSGHSDVLLGVTVTTDEGLHERLSAYRRLHGAIPGPFETFLALRGLRTLSLRVERATASAGELARRVQGHPAVSRVRYPGLPGDPGHAVAAAQWDGFGSVLSLEVAGGAEEAERVCEAVRLWVHATSLGGVESTLERRRRWSAESEEVPESLLRLSVGIEDVEDLWRDLEAALDTLV